MIKNKFVALFASATVFFVTAHVVEHTSAAELDYIKGHFSVENGNLKYNPSRESFASVDDAYLDLRLAQAWLLIHEGQHLASIQNPKIEFVGGRFIPSFGATFASSRSPHRKTIVQAKHNGALRPLGLDISFNEKTVYANVVQVSDYDQKIISNHLSTTRDVLMHSLGRPHVSFIENSEISVTTVQGRQVYWPVFSMQLRSDRPEPVNVGLFLSNAIRRSNGMSEARVQQVSQQSAVPEAQTTAVPTVPVAAAPIAAAPAVPVAEPQELVVHLEELGAQVHEIKSTVSQVNQQVSQISTRQDQLEKENLQLKVDQARQAQEQAEIEKALAEELTRQQEAAAAAEAEKDRRLAKNWTNIRPVAEPTEKDFGYWWRRRLNKPKTVRDLKVEISELNEKEQGVINQIIPVEEKLDGLYQNHDDLFQRAQKAKTKWSKRKFMSQILTVRHEIARTEQMLHSVLYPQLDIIAGHRHNKDIQVQLKSGAEGLPNAEEMASEAANAEMSIADLQTQSELADQSNQTVKGYAQKYEQELTDLMAELEGNSQTTAPTAAAPTAQAAAVPAVAENCGVPLEGMAHAPAEAVEPAPEPIAAPPVHQPLQVAEAAQ